MVLKEAIHAVYPNLTVQRCIIHLLQNSFQYVSDKDLRSFAADFKKVYRAPNETFAWNELEQRKKTCEKKYPHAIQNWEDNWKEIRHYFQFIE